MCRNGVGVKLTLCGSLSWIEISAKWVGCKIVTQRKLYVVTEMQFEKCDKNVIKIAMNKFLEHNSFKVED